MGICGEKSSLHGSAGITCTGSHPILLHPISSNPIPNPILIPPHPHPGPYPTPALIPPPPHFAHCPPSPPNLQSLFPAFIFPQYIYIFFKPKPSRRPSHPTIPEPSGAVWDPMTGMAAGRAAGPGRALKPRPHSAVRSPGAPWDPPPRRSMNVTSQTPNESRPISERSSLFPHRPASA